MKTERAVFTFGSTHHALKAEKVLQTARIKAEVIPVPRRISSLCGLAVQVEKISQEEAKKALEAAGVRVEGVYLDV